MHKDVAFVYQWKEQPVKLASDHRFLSGKQPQRNHQRNQLRKANRYLTSTLTFTLALRYIRDPFDICFTSHIFAVVPKTRMVKLCISVGRWRKIPSRAALLVSFFSGCVFVVLQEGLSIGFSIQTQPFIFPSLWSSSMCSAVAVFQWHFVDCWRMELLYLEGRSECELLEAAVQTSLCFLLL